MKALKFYRNRRRFTALLLAAFFFEMLQTGIANLGDYFALDFGFELRWMILGFGLPFLVLIVMLFVFYRLGKRVNLVEDYRQVAITLFVGGVLGGILGAYVNPIVAHSAECALSPFTRCQSSGSYSGEFIALGFLGVEWVWYGVDMMVYAFFAIALAYFRKPR